MKGRSSAQLKAFARSALLGNYSRIVVIYLLSGLITLGLQSVPGAVFQGNTSADQIGGLVVTFIVSIIIGLFDAGFLFVVLRMIRNEPYNLSCLFYAVRVNPDKYIIVAFIQGLVSYLCSLPAIIVLQGTSVKQDPAGVVLAFILFAMGLLISTILLLGVSQAVFFLLDHEDMEAMESLKESLRLMGGHKGRLFYVEISFFGLFLLGFLSCGLAFLWIMPYLAATRCFFYMDLTGELDERLEAFARERQQVSPTAVPDAAARAEAAAIMEAPAEEAPIEEAPIEEAPIEEAPIEEAPIEEAPAEDNL